MDSTNNPWSNLFPGNNPEAEPNFVDMDSIPSKSQYPNPISSQYKSLYDELLAKCDFEYFRGNEEKAKIANRLYAQLQRITDKNSQELISIRNEAIEKLGIKVSTEDKYNSLLKFCNPTLFKKPYNEDLIEKAIYFESCINQNADNIIELERIEMESQPFIRESLIYLIRLIEKHIEQRDGFNAKKLYSEITIMNEELGFNGEIQEQIKKIGEKIKEEDDRFLSLL